MVTNNTETYLHYREQMDTGDVLLWRSSSLLGWAIRLFSHGTVNHASLVIKLSDWKGLVERIFLLEAAEHGIVLASASKRVQYFNGSVYWCPLKEEFNDNRSKIGGWALNEVGVKYDYASLFKQVLGRVSADAKKFFCSEYVYLAFINAGIVMTWDVDIAPQPSDVFNLGIFTSEVQLV